MIVFISVRLIPGDVVQRMAWEQMGGQGINIEEQMVAIRHKLGLDRPLLSQYLVWLGNMLHGDMGASLWNNSPVVDEIRVRFPVSFELGALGLVIALFIAIPIGIFSAVRQDTWGDYIGRSISILFIAIPSFWIGTMIMIYPSIWWNWSPPTHYTAFFDNPVGNLQQFALPAFIEGMAMSGATMRMTRTMMLEVMRQDYIRTAWSKGLKERVVIVRHALKNSLIPVISLIGLQVPVLVGGSVVLEQIFVLPGVGRLLIDVISSRDYTMISGINVFMAVFILFVNLVVDMTYSWIDPRIRYK
jgi:peptide/nickel transport system permease protein